MKCSKCQGPTMGVAQGKDGPLCGYCALLTLMAPHMLPPVTDPHAIADPLGEVADWFDASMDEWSRTKVRP